MKKVSRPASRSGPLATPISGTVDAERGQRLARGVELALPAVDQHQIGPGRLGIARSPPRRRRVPAPLARGCPGARADAASAQPPAQAARRSPEAQRRLGQQPLEAALQHLAHHAEIVAGREVGRADVELAVLVLAEAFGPGDDHGADRVRALDVAVVVDLDAARRARQAEGLGQRRSSFCCDEVSASLRASASRALASACSTSSFFSPRCGTAISTLWPLLVAQRLGQQRAVLDVVREQDQPRHGLSS